MPDVLGNIFGGLFGLAGNAINAAQNAHLQEKQNQFNLDMWNRNNEYNSPQAQMNRFEEAGLNSALMYGNVSSGNSSAAPVKGVPQMPDWSKNMKELAQAFNIVGLKEQIANMQKAQAEARSAKAAADDAESTNKSLRAFRWDYHFNPETGAFVFDGGIDHRSGDNITTKYVYNTVDAMAEAKVMKLLADNYRTNSLLVPRAGLIGSQLNLNKKRQELLAPQIRYWNFNTVPWRMNTRFWLGNARTGAQILTPFLNW